MTDLRDHLGDIDQHLREIRHDLHAALASMAGQATTGYATSTRPGPGITTPGQGDPAGDTVANARPGRHITQHHPDRHELDQALVHAERLLRRARGIIHKHTPPAEAQPDEGEPGCTSCARVGQHADRCRGDLCAWCYRYRTCHTPGQKVEMPARELVAIFHAKGKVTPTDFRDLKLPLPGATPPKVGARP